MLELKVLQILEEEPYSPLLLSYLQKVAKKKNDVQDNKNEADKEAERMECKMGICIPVTFRIAESDLPLGTDFL